MFDKIGAVLDLAFNGVLAIIFIVSLISIPVFLVLLVVSTWQGNYHLATASWVSAVVAAIIAGLTHIVGDALYG